jgi:hypothetical protein
MSGINALLRDIDIASHDHILPHRSQVANSSI